MAEMPEMAVELKQMSPVKLIRLERVDDNALLINPAMIVSIEERPRETSRITTTHGVFSVLDSPSEIMRLIDL